MLLFFQYNNELLMCNSLCFLSFGITIYIASYIFEIFEVICIFFSFASYCQFQVHSKSSKNIAQGTVRHHTLCIMVSFSLLSLGFFAIRSETLTTFSRIVLFIVDYFPFLENKASQVNFNYLQERCERNQWKNIVFNLLVSSQC